MSFTMPTLRGLITIGTFVFCFFLRMIHYVKTDSFACSEASLQFFYKKQSLISAQNNCLLYPLYRRNTWYMAVILYYFRCPLPISHSNNAKSSTLEAWALAAMQWWVGELLRRIPPLYGEDVVGGHCMWMKNHLNYLYQSFYSKIRDKFVHKKWINKILKQTYTTQWWLLTHAQITNSTFELHLL